MTKNNTLFKRIASALIVTTMITSVSIVGMSASASEINTNSSYSNSDDTNNYSSSLTNDNSRIKKPLISSTYSINATSNKHGTVTTTDLTVKRGGNITIKATPNEGYIIDSISINGADPISYDKNKYTFKNVGESQSVRFIFKEIIDVTTSVGDGKGSIKLENKGTIKEGDDLSFTITPKEGYEIKNVKVNGNNRTNQLVGNTLTLSNVQNDKDIVVNFVKEKNTLTVTTEENAELTIKNKNGDTAQIKYSNNRKIFFTPETGYELESITITRAGSTPEIVGNIDTIAAQGYYKLKNIEEDTTVEFSFKKIETSTPDTSTPDTSTPDTNTPDTNTGDDNSSYTNTEDTNVTPTPDNGNNNNDGGTTGGTNDNSGGTTGGTNDNSGGTAGGTNDNNGGTAGGTNDNNGGTSDGNTNGNSGTTGGTTNNNSGTTGGTTPQTVSINEGEAPLAANPETSTTQATVQIEESDAPLAATPEENTQNAVTEIEDSEIPFAAEASQNSNMPLILGIFAAILASVTGIFFVAKKKQSKENA